MAPKRDTSRFKKLLLFAHNFVKHPTMLGSAIPSSPFLIHHLMNQIDWKQARVIVEYGPGVGTITGEILRRMRPDAHLVVLETNEDFVRFLSTSVRDPRLHVVHGSAADIEAVLERLKIDRADYIISGIPFSMMPEDVRAALVRATRDALRPNGAFLVYQFSSAVLPHLQEVFGTVRKEYELLNIPPAHLYYSTP
ncbi:MAG TPA: methyltransferase [Longimicrobiaceae bacterium]|nr:methyltransferase [Longimicrobiaceae bacterium]